MDTGNGMTIWGRDFDGFIQREPTLFAVFKYAIKRIAVGIKHGLAIDVNKKLYVWGDGTYGELGEDPEIGNHISDVPSKLAYFDNKDIKVHSVSAGHRHSIVVDTEGRIYSFGDNSMGQLATYEERHYTPEKIDADFQALAVFSGLNHNIVKTKDGGLYKWGGNNKLKSGANKGGSFVEFMYEFKGKRTTNIQTAHDNTIVISHLKVFKERTTN
jgi:alpha-tubulin suppressor-like RCC1 family protein